jgi:hypothetical protein
MKAQDIIAAAAVLENYCRKMYEVSNFDYGLADIVHLHFSRE